MLSHISIKWNFGLIFQQLAFSSNSFFYFFFIENKFEKILLFIWNRKAWIEKIPPAPAKDYACKYFFMCIFFEAIIIHKSLEPHFVCSPNRVKSLLSVVSHAHCQMSIKEEQFQCDENFMSWISFLSTQFFIVRIEWKQYLFIFKRIEAVPLKELTKNDWTFISEKWVCSNLQFV